LNNNRVGKLMSIITLTYKSLVLNFVTHLLHSRRVVKYNGPLYREKTEKIDSGHLCNCSSA